jgi:hypothetical protein
VIAVAAAGSADIASVKRWSQELSDRVGDRSRGVSELVEWVVLSWSGQFEAGVELCLRAARDARFTQDTRDLFLGIATADRFGKLSTDDERFELAAEAISAAERGTCLLQRTVCLLGGAWALHLAEPARSVVLARQALDLMPQLPAFLRRMLPGSVSRLMTQIDPRVAAEDLLGRLSCHSPENPSMDLIHVVYASGLLYRVGHPIGGPAMATLARSSIAPNLVVTGFDTMAREAAARYEAMPLDGLHEAVRRALAPDEHHLWSALPPPERRQTVDFRCQRTIPSRRIRP